MESHVPIVIFLWAKLNGISLVFPSAARTLWDCQGENKYLLLLVRKEVCDSATHGEQMCWIRAHSCASDLSLGEAINKRKIRGEEAASLILFDCIETGNTKAWALDVLMILLYRDGWSTHTEVSHAAGKQLFLYSHYNTQRHSEQ